MTYRFLAATLCLAACSSPESDTGNQTDASPAVATGNAAAEPPLEPPAPGAAGGLPDDRKPVAEAPFDETSAQGAANVVQTYYGLIEAGRYREAWRLWSDGGRASGMSEQDFADSFGRYREYHALVGAPGRIEGAAGSLYVEVPVQVYGRLRSGERFDRTGPVVLRRANDVPGSTAEQRRWHIAEVGVRPSP